MANKQHKEKIAGKTKFCSTKKGGKCGCSLNNDYVEVCRPKWGTLKYPEKHATKGGVMKVFEAHHILCVNEIASFLVGPKVDKGYGDELEGTVWCINAKKNMIALPRWGHTIMWYCKTSILDFTFDWSGNVMNLDEFAPLAKDAENRPPFKDLPQHDYGHKGASPQGYSQDVGEDLEEYSNSLQEAVQEHDNETLGQIAPRLNALSNKYRSTLKSRGKRVHGGTHGAWKKALDNPNVASWYVPFSMAETATPMVFPGGKGGKGLLQKIERFAHALFKIHWP